jgi:hypothetical protein
MSEELYTYYNTIISVSVSANQISSPYFVLTMTLMIVL